MILIPEEMAKFVHEWEALYVLYNANDKAPQAVSCLYLFSGTNRYLSSLSTNRLKRNIANTMTTLWRGFQEDILKVLKMLESILPEKHSMRTIVISKENPWYSGI
jgi:hypothetical protein